MIFSHVTLSRVAPNVKDCLKNLYTTHEDVELGRCVQRFAGIPCTWSYEVFMKANLPLNRMKFCLNICSRLGEEWGDFVKGRRSGVNR